MRKLTFEQFKMAENYTEIEADLTILEKSRKYCTVSGTAENDYGTDPQQQQSALP